MVFKGSQAVAVFKKKTVKCYCKIPLPVVCSRSEGALGQRSNDVTSIFVSRKRSHKGLYLNCALCIYKGSWP